MVVLLLLPDSPGSTALNRSLSVQLSSTKSLRLPADEVAGLPLAVCPGPDARFVSPFSCRFVFSRQNRRAFLLPRSFSSLGPKTSQDPTPLPEWLAGAAGKSLRRIKTSDRGNGEALVPAKGSCYEDDSDGDSAAEHRGDS